VGSCPVATRAERIQSIPFLSPFISLHARPTRPKTLTHAIECNLSVFLDIAILTISSLDCHPDHLFLELPCFTMPSWTLELIGPGGKHVDSFHQNLSPCTRATIYVEGNTDDAMTWKFSQHYDETQAKGDWVCQFGMNHYLYLLLFLILTWIVAEFVAGALKFVTDLCDTFIHSPSPVHGLLSRIKVPYSDLDHHHYLILLRPNDVIDFENKQVQINISFDTTNGADANVQVESSGPGATTRQIKEEEDANDETDDDAMLPPSKHNHRGTSADESQNHVYSTSRENLSPTPRPRESQVVVDTPNRRRIRSQHESTVPESLPMDTFHLERPGDTSKRTPDIEPDVVDADELPGTGKLPDPSYTDDLPDTSQTNLFHVQTDPIVNSSYANNSFVDKVVESLNQDPADQISELTAVAPPEYLYDKSSISTKSRTATPEVEQEVIQQDTAQPSIIEDMPTVGSVDPIDTLDPVDTINEVVTSTKRKRKTVQDHASAKRTKFAVSHDKDAPTSSVTPASVTPASTASRRPSARCQNTGTPSSTRSLRRKSLEDGRSTVSRRVSRRHGSIDDGEMVPPGSPSLRGGYSGVPPDVLFSNTKVHEKKALMKFMATHGATQAKDIKQANFLCVGRGELLKTSKLLHSLTLGKTVVTDDWVTHSAKAGHLLDAKNFLPEELKHADRTQVFSNQTIYVTPALRMSYKKGWDDVMAIIRQAGGALPLTGPLAKLDTDSVTLYLGAEKDDAIAAELQDAGKTVYRKDILGASIVHGELLLESSLELPVVKVVAKTTANTKAAKKGGRAKK
jgi:hypothetical protein